MIWSAVAASCAIPFIFGATSLFCKGPEGEAKPYTLMNRKYLDGSIAHDLPMNKLSIFFNVNNFIVSQTNPWVIPFMNSTEYFRTTSNGFVIRLLIVLQHLKEFFASELRHRVGQIGFIFPKATKFFNLATQSYVGNITIWPVPSLSNYLRILENPTEFKRIMNFVEDGRFRTYPSTLPSI
jgi:predicted acylesterase/phospholipase RssA